MRLGTRAAVYGIAGLVLAGALIFSGSSLGFLNPSSTGVLSVLLTDPPTVPSGVSAVYVTYSNLAVHAVGFGDSGWVAIPGGGTIDTLKLVNLSQTISSAKVPSLTYNLVAFNITSVVVDYMGKNYTTSVDSGRLVVPFVGGLKVNSSSPAAALIDIQPTVLNLGNQSTPTFTMAAGAKALQVPHDEVSNAMENVGNNYTLQGRHWFQSFNENRSIGLTISQVTLASNSFGFLVTNGGNDSVAIRWVIVTSIASGAKARDVVNSLANSFVFAVESDGSLKLVNATPGQVQSLLGSAGYSVAGNSSHQFTFSGTITNLMGRNGVSSGTTYYVTVLGPETRSNQTVIGA